jgi:hypothetical protein
VYSIGLNSFLQCAAGLLSHECKDENCTHHSDLTFNEVRFTKGNWYKLEYMNKYSTDEGAYSLVDDDLKLCTVSSEYFKNMTEVRDSKIKNILNG